MQTASGLLFLVALVLAVALGGQTIDYSWGPALLAAALALFFLIPEALGSRRRGYQAAAAVAMALAWVLWRCQSSPVREAARADALLCGGLAAGFIWGWMLRSTGSAYRILLAGLSLLGCANLVLGSIQLREPSFAWPFATRPAVFPSGLFGHYNHLADFSLVAASLLGASLLLGKERLAGKLVTSVGFLSNVAAVAISGSRGGMLSLCLAVAVLAGLKALVAWRDKTRQWRLALLSVVVVPMVVAGIAVPVLAIFQERRGHENAGLTTFADNESRLQLMGTAVDLAMEQPWQGGGSRSFSWRKYSAWDTSEDGVLPANDEFVHNELLQAVTDYGWVGAGLIAVAVLTIIFFGIAGLLSDPRQGNEKRGDALACGALAALAGTLLHSNFSFVVHTIPGALYLGLVMGGALPRRTEGDLVGSMAPRLGLVALVVVIASGIAFAGVRGSRAYLAVWPVLFGKERLARVSPAMATDRIREALEIWPGARLAGAGGQIARQAAAREDLPPEEKTGKLREAEDFYASAVRFHPFDPSLMVNQANLLSELGEDNAAESAFERAIELQGGMESIFRARYFLARHLFRRWYYVWTFKRRPEEALAGFLRARELLREAEYMTAPWVLGQEGKDLRKGLDETISFLEGAGIVPAPASP